MIRQIDHIVITTAVPEPCLDFYGRLGFEVREAGGRYELLSGSFKINVHIKDRELSPHAKNVQAGSADLCFEIDESLSGFKSKLEAHGLVVELGIVERMGAKGPMRSIYLRDPDGNLLEFCSYE